MTRSMTRWMLAGFMALAALGAAALSVGVAEAGKPGGGGAIPPGTGTIYFIPGNGGIGLWSMNADGSGKTALPTSVDGVPSNQKHGGARWFLYGFHAIREDGSSDVQLWSDTTTYIRQAVWGRDDSFVSFQWRDDAAGYVWRISRFDIAFDANGVPSAAGGPVAVSGIAANSYTDQAHHTWSPSGDRVAWIDYYPGIDNYPEGRLYVTTVATGATTSIASTSIPWPFPSLAWSPDGARILFRSGQGIDTIDPSGANRRNILQGSQSTSGSGKNLKITIVELSAADWSPDGAAIVYRRHVRESQPYLYDPRDRHYVPDYSDVYRASADGSAQQNLTSGPNWPNTGLAVPIAWR